MSGGRWVRVALSTMCGLALLNAGSARGETVLSLRSEGESRLVRLELRLGLGERKPTVEEAWDEAFMALGEFFDRNGDGRLDRAEAARLPSPFSLRQTLWGQFALDFEIGRKVPELKEGETLALADLAAHYRRHGIGNTIMATGRVEATPLLNDAFVRHLDRDRSGVVDLPEWNAAAEMLAPLDLNDDELIGPGELNRRVTSYPGASGTVLVSPLKPTREVGAASQTFLLPVGAKNDAPPPAGSSIHVILLRDESFGSEPTPPDVEQPSAIYLDPSSKIPGLELRVRPERGRLQARTGELRISSQTWFDKLDTVRDGVVAAEEADGTQRAAFDRCLAVADRNDDRRLSRAEHDAWLDLQTRIAAAQALLTVIDFGHGWFEQVDADHDGGLSVRELRTAGARLAAAGYVAADASQAKKQPPQVLSITVSRGHPRSLLADGARSGPRWFQGMDRNRDGDVSRREWLLDTEALEKLDADRDGLLDPTEAQTARSDND